jgi:hypothetical protein
MLDDPRRKAVAAVGYFSHCASLPLGRASGLSGYPDKAAQTYQLENPDTGAGSSISPVGGKLGSSAGSNTATRQ